MSATAGPFADLDDEAVLAVHVDTTCAAGEREAAFRELVDRFHRRVFAVCRRTLDDDADAEDVTQEVFLRLARKAGTFRGDAKLSTWLYAVARNAATDRIRHDARRPATPVADVAPLGDAAGHVVEDGAEARATATDVGHALAQLDALSRALLWLVAVEGLSYADAAAVHDVPVGTVKSRVSRARVELGRLLAADRDADPSPRPPAVRSEPGHPPGDPSTPTRGPPHG